MLQLCKGDLLGLVAETRYQTIQGAADLFCQVMACVSACHKMGVIHRDIKVIGNNRPA
jgi:serine/threonine protein kinase